MYDTFEAVRQHGYLDVQYKWVIRLRSDLFQTPNLKTNINKLDADVVHINGAWHNWGQNRSRGQFLPRDYHFIVPRRRADAFFAVGLDFLMCQTRALNLRVCDNVQAWPMYPECILKTHLRVCDIPFVIF